ncbi:DDE-type integrase/transposase/recombinase, partial [Paraburkholderia podalyriae]|uniref:DDE-type integrase/transposase/recombinase n=1 Tax=Paraburkholderia podalyriae TaxID=1938811 RepID=UPI001FE9081E
LNNVVEQDHRAIKRITRPMLGFKDFHCARVILSGVELMHMIKGGFKGEAQQRVNERKLKLWKRLRAYVRTPRMANEMHA